MASRVSVVFGDNEMPLVVLPRVVVAALTTDWMVELLVMLTALLKVGPRPAAVAPLESSTKLPPERMMPADPIGSKAPEAVLPVNTKAGGVLAEGVKVNEVLVKDEVVALLRVTTPGPSLPMAVITVPTGTPDPLTPMPTDSLSVLLGVMSTLLLVVLVRTVGVVPSTVIVEVESRELALLV